jgi:hypothetical protein
LTLGTIFTTADGEPIKAIPSGDLFLDFRNGTITDSAGTVTLMNTNLDYYGLTQCQSFAVFASDADTGINVGNVLTIKDHQLTHVIESYAFDQIRLSIPANSKPDASNQLMFVASTTEKMNYVFNNYAHYRSNLTGTTDNTFTDVVSHHTGGYDQVLFTIYNTHGSNSMNIKVQFSENGSTWFDAQGYTAATGVTIANGSYEAFATDIAHHFYRVQVQSTSSGNHATYQIFWNYVSLNN